MRITEMLKQLSLAAGLLRRIDAENIATVANKRVRTLIGADVVKMYWKTPVKDGHVLTPFGADTANGIAMPEPFFVGDTYQGGILSWAMKYRRSLWLEHMRDLDGTAPAHNLFIDARSDPTGGLIGIEYLREITQDHMHDSMLVIPTFSQRNELVGMYVLEFSRSDEIGRELIGAAKRLADGLTRLYEEAEVTESTLDNTHQALHNFLDDLSDDDIESELAPLSGFIARPFQGKAFADLERRVTALFEMKQIRARSYRPHTRHAIVIEAITNQIKRCHFGIADITGANPNVMAEVGMMMALSKRVLLLRQKDSAIERPFNVAGFDVHDYRLGSDSADIDIWNPANGRWEPFEQTLNRFVTILR